MPTCPPKRSARRWKRFRAKADDARVVDAMTIDELAAKMDAQFAAVDAKMEQGFNDSKIRDERLEALINVAGEAREVLRDEIHRRFVTADRKHDEQFKLLKEAVQHLSSRK